MPRQKNTRPTNIYWLYDTRPETVALFGAEGHPFYCGKTVFSPNRRLRGHRADARRSPARPVSVQINACGDNDVRIQIMEVVSAHGDWCAREKFWILTLRTFHPGAANIADGGQGVPGYVHSPESIARMKKWKPSDEQRAKQIAAQMGKQFSAETRAKIAEANTGRRCSAETRAKMVAALTGKKHSAESRAKMSKARTGKKLSKEHVAKMVGRKQSDEARLKNSISKKGMKFSAEHRAKLSASAIRRCQREAANA